MALKFSELSKTLNKHFENENRRKDEGEKNGKVERVVKDLIFKLRLKVTVLVLPM